MAFNIRHTCKVWSWLELLTFKTPLQRYTSMPYFLSQRISSSHERTLKNSSQTSLSKTTLSYRRLSFRKEDRISKSIFLPNVSWICSLNYPASNTIVIQADKLLENLFHSYFLWARRSLRGCFQKSKTFLIPLWNTNFSKGLKIQTYELNT